MKKNTIMIENSIKRIQALGLTCDIETENETIHFYNGHEYVEIGGIKWATMNLGATSPTEKGLYFQWGDTQGYTTEEIGGVKKYFYWEDYKLSTAIIIKYNNNDGKTVLDAEDDAVTAAWGKGWRMPRIEEFMLLDNAANTSWVRNYKGSGVNGFLYTDKKDSRKVVFFPASGYMRNGIINCTNQGYCWSSSLSNSTFYSARHLHFNSMERYYNDASGRCTGYPVRGILDV